MENTKEEQLRQFLLAANYFLTCADNISTEKYLDLNQKIAIKNAEKEVERALKKDIFIDIIKFTTKKERSEEFARIFKLFYEVREAFFQKLISLEGRTMELFMVDFASGVYDEQINKLKNE